MKGATLHNSTLAKKGGRQPEKFSWPGRNAAEPNPKSGKKSSYLYPRGRRWLDGRRPARAGGREKDRAGGLDRGGSVDFCAGAW